MVARRRLRYIRHGLLVAATLAITPAFAANPDNGERLAHRWCASCYVVSATQRGSSTDQAPPFATIAKLPDFNAAKIAVLAASELGTAAPLWPKPELPDGTAFSFYVFF